MSSETSIHTTVHVLPENGAWAAVSVDFSVVGTGDSPDAAVDSMLDALVVYFAECLRQGENLADTRRPISAEWERQIKRKVAVNHILARVGEFLRRPVVSARTFETDVPATGLAFAGPGQHVAAC